MYICILSLLESVTTKSSIDMKYWKIYMNIRKHLSGTD